MIFREVSLLRCRKVINVTSEGVVATCSSQGVFARK